ncbi:MAG: VanZ family protein [Marinilabiliaceae bacterium]|nr:VanZ family protein [Marinilabiliaceae bacterium]
MMKFFSFYKKTIILIILITMVSLMNFQNIEPDKIPNIPHLDKVVHFGMYLTLTFTFMWENYCRHQYHFILSRFIIIIIAVVAMGVMIEWLQANFTVSRSGSVGDAMANSAGLMMGMILFRITKTNHYIKSKIFKA